MATTRPLPKGERAKATLGKTNIPGYDDKLVVPDDRVLQQKGGDLAIYADLLRDDQVRSTFQQRRLAVTSTEWEVDPGGEAPIDEEAAEFLRAQLEATDWDQVTDQMLYGVFYGYAVAEILWEQQEGRVGIGAIKVRDRARFAFGTSGTLYLRQEVSSKLTAMPERKFWTFSTGADNSDAPYGLGLAHSLFWPVFFKRNGTKFWLNFLEKYASPTAIGRMPGGQYRDAKLRDEVLETLQAIATDAVAVVPEGTSVEFLEAMRGGTTDYSTLCDQMDAAISKVVLSQTMTTDNGSSRSQSETHKDVRDEVVKADADLICESFNRSVALWLTELNFPGAQVPRVFRKTEPEEDLSERSERDKRLVEMGLEPTDDYILETYGPGWVRRQGGEQRVEDPAANFAELAALTASKNAHRADEQALVAFAEHMARQYQGQMGRQVTALLEELEASEDLASFKEKLGRLAAAPPNQEAVQSMQRAGIVARLMGRLRGER
ncbi:MAG: DUF935 domain-containing protein [Halomonas sp.]